MMRGKRVEGKPAEAGTRRRAGAARSGEVSVTKASPSAVRRFDRAPAQVRIIGGQWKRTPLPVPDAPGLRPSPDRVRETLFNWLAHFIPDASAATALDLFAGTGALGFEFASRGGARVTMVERNPALVGQLNRTREKLGASAVTVVAGDGVAFARASEPRSYDVVFLDPPFDAGLLGPALLEASRLVTDGGFVYVESGSPLATDVARADGLAIVRTGRAGQVHFHLLQKA
jgi:16S rRNA (guanine(966)-N(2))-methyltransferase RsmD